MRTSTRHFDPMSANEKFEPIFPCRFRYLVLRTHCQQLDLNWDVEPIYNKGRCVELWMMMARPIIHDEPFRRRHPFSLQLISQVEFFDTKETSWLMNGQHSATRFVRTNLSVFSVLQVLKYLSNEQSRKKEPNPLLVRPRDRVHIHHMQIAEKEGGSWLSETTNHPQWNFPSFNWSLPLNPTCFCTGRAARNAIFSVWNWAVQKDLTRHQCRTGHSQWWRPPFNNGIGFQSEINGLSR